MMPKSGGGGELSFSRAVRAGNINFGPRRDITAYKANFHIALDITIKNYPFSFSCAHLCIQIFMRARFPDLSLGAVDFYFSRSVLKVKHSHRTNRALSCYNRRLSKSKAVPRLVNAAPSALGAHSTHEEHQRFAPSSFL
jgi:hypothetical protein